MSTSNVVQLERLMEIDEVLAVLGISRSKLYQLVREGGIPAVKIGRSVRFRPSSVQTFIEKSETAPAPAALVRGR